MNWFTIALCVCFLASGALTQGFPPPHLSVSKSDKIKPDN